MEWKRNRLRVFYCFSIFFFSICALFTATTTTTTTCIDIRCELSGKADLSIQEIDKRRGDGGIAWSMARRILSGPGSSPPRCTSKCGKCKPCKPVHVPVPPGTPVTTEYYPEAWRCKCGNKLYMP